MEVVEKQTGKKPKEAIYPNEFPQLLIRVWNIFTELSDRRGSGMNGPNLLSYSEIDSYKRVTDTPLNAREVRTLIEIDNEFIKACHD